MDIDEVGSIKFVTSHKSSDKFSRDTIKEWQSINYELLVTTENQRQVGFLINTGNDQSSRLVFVKGFNFKTMLVYAAVTFSRASFIFFHKQKTFSHRIIFPPCNKFTRHGLKCFQLFHMIYQRAFNQPLTSRKKKHVRLTFIREMLFMHASNLIYQTVTDSNRDVTILNSQGKLTLW